MSKPKVPLAAKALIAALVGVVLGQIFGKKHYLFGLSNQDLGELGLLVVRVLKALATPLIFVAILDAFLKTRITAKRGGRLILICLMNVSVAMTIGLLVINTLQPGKSWEGRTDALMGRVEQDSGGKPALPKPPGASTTGAGAPKPTLDPLKNFAGYIPESVFEPFVKNSVISIVLLGVLAGAALRRIKDRQKETGERSIETLESLISVLYQALLQMLEWVVQTVPYAVLLVIASVVGRSGLEVFKDLWIFFITILLGMAIHALLYYPAIAWFMGKKSPKVFLGEGADAILTGLTTNSSLATVPVTLRSLKRMGVSSQSARLAACVGTNLNNDGITLYEAMTALFLSQALGYHLGIGQQLTIVFASIMAGAGIAGIPEAGLIVLPLVLSAAGLPNATVALVIPLIIPVDWIIARCRSGVNVMGDMVVAIQLDRSLSEADREALLEEVEGQ